MTPYVIPFKTCQTKNFAPTVSLILKVRQFFNNLFPSFGKCHRIKYNHNSIHFFHGSADTLGVRKWTLHAIIGRRWPE